MGRPMRSFLAVCAVTCLSAGAYAQSSPIPDKPVPAFGGKDARLSDPDRSPAGSGSNTGSNVGAGESASPIPDGLNPSTPPLTSQAPLTDVLGNTKPK